MKFLAVLLILVGAALPAVALDVRSAVLRVDEPALAPISRLDEKPTDLGFAGAALATEDNATTGGFLGHRFETAEIAVASDALDGALARIDPYPVVVVLARAEALLRVADAFPGKLILNIGAPDTRLRDVDCRRNVLHVTPSDAMRADAVAQFAAWKKWSRVLLVHGSNPADLQLAETYRRAAIKFGLRVVEEREIEDTGGTRRADTGHVQVQRQIPTLLQRTREHDVVFAADASDVFAPYLPFHVWDPRPVLGSAGLRPVSFHPAAESWGGTQFQNRFERLAGRRVTEADFDAWIALRAVGEAVTRTGSVDPEVLRSYMLGADFTLSAYKGQPLSFRDWNGQLRQPVLLFDGRINASVSPQEGFLHRVSPLDTLGLDREESACEVFG